MSWFDEVTGSNEYERQSWRDSYNGGRAAGDWTGNTNARLDSERDRFQGATWSGSSSQPSALELARSMVGPGVAAVTSGTGAIGTGPGNAAVARVPQSGGGSLTFSGPGPLTPKVKDAATGGYAGVEVKPNPWFSDVENWWEPRYGEPGEWLGGIVNIGADAVFNVRVWADALRSPTAPKVAGPRGYDPIWGNPGGQQAFDFVGGVGRGFVPTGPTPEADLPDPMVWRPASAW